MLQNSTVGLFNLDPSNLTCSLSLAVLLTGSLASSFSLMHHMHPCNDLVLAEALTSSLTVTFKSTLGAYYEIRPTKISPPLQEHIVLSIVPDASKGSPTLQPQSKAPPHCQTMAKTSSKAKDKGRRHRTVRLRSYAALCSLSMFVVNVG